MLQDREDLEMNITEWLRPSNMRNIHQTLLKDRLSGTCEWIWSQTAVADWKAAQHQSPPDDRILSAYGIPGCGKSVLASSMVQSMRDQGQTVLFFSFSSMDSSRSTHDDLARSFLWQLLEDSTTDERLDVMRRLMLKQPVTLDLWTAFTNIAKLRSQPMIWVIDALDECQQPSSEIFAQITTLLTDQEGSRCVILGRAGSFDSLDTKNAIKITPNLISPDIDNFIRSEVAKPGQLRSPEIRDLAQNTLQAKAHGMFLWVKFAIGDLNKPASNAVLKERLRHFPHGLKPSYRHIIATLVERLDDIDRKLACALLSLMIAARRPLKLDELQYALAIATWLDSNSTKPFEFSEFAATNFVPQLLFLCGDLISISDHTVSLVHTSAKEFLLNPGCIDPEGNIVACLRIDSAESHRLFYSVCLTYLNIGRIGSHLAIDELSTSSSSAPLFDYASQNLIYHFNRMGTLAQPLDDATFHFAGTTSCVHWLEDHFVRVTLGGCRSDVEEFILFVAWLRHNEDGIEVSQNLQERIKRQFHERLQNFGEDDWRTGTLMDLYRYMFEDTAIALEDAKQTSTSGLQIDGILQLLAHDGPLPTQTQFCLLRNVQKYLHRMESLTAPLELLFCALLRNAARIPTLALLNVGIFYNKVGKHEKALEVLHSALARTVALAIYGTFTYAPGLATFSWYSNAGQTRTSGSVSF